MAVVPSEHEQRVVLRNVDWDLYERLLDAREDNPTPLYTYDRGWLEIMSALLPEHEEVKLCIELLVNIITGELDLDLRRVGSTTLKRADVQGGAEPDCSYYIQHAEQMRGKDRLDLMVDPPPDLAVEVDITHATLDKLPVYARFGVPEVWRYRGGRVEIWMFAGDRYGQSTGSGALPGVTADALVQLLAEREKLGNAQWQRRVRDWARGLGGC